RAVERSRRALVIAPVSRCGALPRLVDRLNLTGAACTISRMAASPPVPLAVSPSLGRLIDQFGAGLLTLESGPLDRGRTVTSVHLYDPASRAPIDADAV